VEKRAEITDHEQVQEHQAKLLLLCKRSMALPVGRGMFTLASLYPLLTEPLPIPPLSLAGRVPPTNATIALDTSGYAAELSLWPEFHNGVAAGLRLASGVTNLTRTWIVYNKPTAPDYSHAGLLMALGLHSHLTALAMTDIFVYLSQGHDATSVGVCHIFKCIIRIAYRWCCA
jgi:anaphase-promoting complex subunit 1